MDEIGRLLLFKDVIDAGGFSHAAARRGLSHSTVSKHVKALEAELGVLLLNRTSRTMSLTEAGSVVLGFSRHVGASVSELRERLDELRGEVAGELRVASLLHTGKHLVQPAVRRFVEEFPGSRVRLTLDDGPLHFNREGYDVAVRVGLGAEGNLIAQKLLDNDVCIVAAPSLLARVQAPVHPSDLASLPTVGYQSREFDITGWTYIEDGQFRTVEVDPVCRVNDGNGLLDLVLGGMGIGYLSWFSAREFLASGALVQLLPEFDLPPYDPVFVIHASVEYPSPKVKAFKRHLFAVAAKVSA